MLCFVAQSFVLAAFATLVCQRNCVFLCKGTKLQKAALFALFGLRRILGIVMPVFLWHRALLWLLLKKQGNSTLAVQEWGWRTSRGMFCVVFMWFLRGCGAGLGARGSRVFVSFFIYFICSPSNNFLFFYSV